MEPPQTSYVRSGGVSIAYQLFGEGDLQMVLVPPIINHVDMDWDDARMRRFLTRFGSFGRVALFDKRGQGLSDRMSGVPTLEERVDDLRAVMDVAGFERAALIGASEGGLMALTFAATHPDRVSHLCLTGTFARLAQADDYPFGMNRDAVEPLLAAWSEIWGMPESPTVSLFMPTRVGDHEFVKWMNRFERACCTGTTFLETMRLNLDLDIRDIVPTIQTPTLLMHRTHDRVVPIEHGYWLADHLPNARFLEMPGSDHALVFSNDSDIFLDEMEAFLTGSVAHADIDRVLATVLFTDVVDSTARAAAVGDREWRNLLECFDDLTAKAVARHRGRIVNDTGDGHLATFDGPARAIKCATEIERAANNSLDIDVRAGLHTGEIELRGDNVSGIAVHLAARVAAKAKSNEVLVSRTVTDLVAGSGLAFVDAGTHELKGVPGEWQLFALAP